MAWMDAEAVRVVHVAGMDAEVAAAALEAALGGAEAAVGVVVAAAEVAGVAATEDLAGAGWGVVALAAEGRA